jgi:hypothetical protein
MKKMIIFLAAIIVLFGTVILITKYQKHDKTRDNPYAKAKNADQLIPLQLTSLVIPYIKIL